MLELVRRGLRRATVAGVLLAASSAACGLLLGVQDLQPGDAGPDRDATKDVFTSEPSADSSAPGDASVDSSAPSDAVESSPPSDVDYGVRCGTNPVPCYTPGACCEVADGSTLTFFCVSKSAACGEAGGTVFSCADQAECKNNDPSSPVCCQPLRQIFTQCRSAGSGCAGALLCDPSVEGGGCPASMPICKTALPPLGNYGYSACMVGG